MCTCTGTPGKSVREDNQLAIALKITIMYEPCNYLRRPFWCTDPPREIPFADLSSSLFMGNQPYVVGSLSLPPTNIDRRSWTSRRSIHAQGAVTVEEEDHAVLFFVVK